MVPNHTLPLRHLDRMRLVVPRNLSNRLDAHQGFLSHLGLEGACIPLPFSFAHSSAVLSCPAEPEKSNLATGPNYGVHFLVDNPQVRQIKKQRAELVSELNRLKLELADHRLPPPAKKRRTPRRSQKEILGDI